MAQLFPTLKKLMEYSLEIVYISRKSCEDIVTFGTILIPKPN